MSVVVAESVMMVALSNVFLFILDYFRSGFECLVFPVVGSV